ncbi:NAD(P)H-hydrate dehydratase [Bdellovibrio sp. HCB337]|uniref:NAD(P)H-hydrate dehydratase n=1 Tax=Bdellovibrio sp. HCB337 TaxID=3394358 RepID=UPI0039A66BE6
MRLATREEAYSIDKSAAEDYGLSSSLLIEKAGHSLAQAFEKIFLQQKWNLQSRIGIWCGSGNNGADGRVMAHLLREKKYNVEVLQGTSWSPQSYDIVIDALFGVGLNRPIEGDLQKQILKLNKTRKKVFAVDIPSGLDANTGVILGAAVKAQWTLTVAPAKPGLFLNEGPVCCGRVRAVAIGFPTELLQEKAQSVFLIGGESARRLLPSRSMTGNKAKFGHLLVLAGSAGMEGAALLVSEAAARMGCGYVTLCSPSAEIHKKSRPDFLRLSIDGFFKSDLKKYSAVVVGPGLGVNTQTSEIMEHLRKHHARVLVDADALTVLAQNPAMKLPSEWLLTPHAGELSRFLKIDAKSLEADRLQSAERAQTTLGSVLLFKGFRTVVAAPRKRYIIGSGNVALAKAGTGDVLAGFIGSLMAQGLPTLKAAVLGAYLHGRIADDWLRRAHSARTLMASDLPELIDASLRSLKKGL